MRTERPLEKAVQLVCEFASKNASFQKYLNYNSIKGGLGHLV